MKGFSRLPEFHDESDLVKCLKNWKNWLSIESLDQYGMILDYFALFSMIIYANYFIQ